MSSTSKRDLNARDVHLGGCLCGAIRYTVAGSPVSTNACYCSQCQKQTGAPMPAFVSFQGAQLTLLSGEPAQYRSSERATREFCARCGSSLFWREEGNLVCDVFLGSFDEPGRFAPPAYAIWSAHRVPWLADLPGMQTFVGPREG